MITVAIIGGVLHNVGQIIIASVILKNVGIFTYVPILMIAGNNYRDSYWNSVQYSL